MLVKLSTSSMKIMTNVSFWASSIDSIFPKSLVTSFPLSLKYLLKSEWASNSTNLLVGYVFLSRMESCCARARQRVVFPVPGDF